MDKELYVYGESLIRVLPYFLYEINVYKHWDRGVCLEDSKLIKSGRVLALKQVISIVHYKNFFIEKSITLIGAPREFIEDSHLIRYKKIDGKKKQQKKISKV